MGGSSVEVTFCLFERRGGDVAVLIGSWRKVESVALAAFRFRERDCWGLGSGAEVGAGCMAGVEVAADAAAASLAAERVTLKDMRTYSRSAPRQR